MNHPAIGQKGRLAWKSLETCKCFTSIQCRSNIITRRPESADLEVQAKIGAKSDLSTHNFLVHTVTAVIRIITAKRLLQYLLWNTTSDQHLITFQPQKNTHFKLLIVGGSTTMDDFECCSSWVCNIVVASCNLVYCTTSYKASDNRTAECKAW